MLSFKEYLLSEEKQIITARHLKLLEMLADKLLEKFGVDIEFTKHFGERISDERNRPAIELEELIEFFKKIQAKKATEIKKLAGNEAVLRDLQKDLNIPVVIDFEKGEFVVTFKTIMRKKNFKSPDKKIDY